MFNKYRFFDYLIELGEYANRSSNLLNRIYHEFNYDDMKYLMIEMQNIENSADISNHNLIKSLKKTYILPMRKEDIIEIADSIDSIIDSINALTEFFYTFALKDLKKDTISFIEIISESILLVNEMLKSLKANKKTLDLTEYLKKLEYLEDRADKLYLSITKDLFAKEDSIAVLMAWQRIIHQMEKCTDLCRDTGVILSKAIFKNA